MANAASFTPSTIFARIDRQAEQNAIQIHLGPQGWLATFTGPHSAEIAELFDTCTLPYTARMPLGTVIAEVQARNPGVAVFHFSSQRRA